VFGVDALLVAGPLLVAADIPGILYIIVDGSSILVAPYLASICLEGTSQTNA